MGKEKNISLIKKKSYVYEASGLKPYNRFLEYFALTYIWSTKSLILHSKYLNK